MEPASYYKGTVEQPRLKLVVYSHAHSPPLSFHPDLKYDLRKIGGPPPHIRKQYDGRSKRLRDHLLHNAGFHILLEKAVEDIQAAADDVLKAWRTVQANGPTNDQTDEWHDVEESDAHEPHSVAADDPNTGSTLSARASNWQKAPYYDSTHEIKDQEEHHCDHERGDEESNLLHGENVAWQPSEGPVLRIGCFCEHGFHRSVAFAEELGRRRWPKAWVVEVIHRDVDGMFLKGAKRKKRRKGKGDVIDVDIDDRIENFAD